MAEVTYFVALPFVAADDGIAAGELTECFNPSAAVVRADTPFLVERARLDVSRVRDLASAERHLRPLNWLCQAYEPKRHRAPLKHRLSRGYGCFVLA